MSAPDGGDAQVALLEELMASVSGAISAMVDWDIEAFHASLSRQMAICAELAKFPQPSSQAAETARRVIALNRVYRRMVEHSVQWTRTLNSINPAGNEPDSSHNCYRG